MAEVGKRKVGLRFRHSGAVLKHRNGVLKTAAVGRVSAGIRELLKNPPLCLSLTARTGTQSKESREVLSTVIK